MKFKTKLYAGMGSYLVMMILLVVFLIQMLDHITVNMNVVVKDLSERVRLTSSIQYEIANLDRELKGLTSNPPEDLVRNFTNNMEKSQLNTKIAIESLKKMDTREKPQELISRFSTLYETYLETTQQIITLQKTGMKAEYEKLLWYDLKQIRERLSQNADLLYTLQEQEMKNELYRTRATYTLFTRTVYTYASIALLIGVGMTLWLIRSLTKNLNRVTSVMTGVSPNTGTELPRIEITSKDEIGAIAVAFNGMAQAIEEHSRQEQELKEEAQEKSWLKTKVAEIAAIYPKVDHLQDFASLFITKLAPMVGASYGVYYSVEGKGREQRLIRTASYAALELEGYESFRMGEGLIGQCAVGKKPIHLQGVPGSHIEIVSGNGMLPPADIMIMPAVFEGEVLAVIELASIRAFTIPEQLLLLEVMGSIGIAIQSIKSRMQVDYLLQESQALTEELQSQSEELQMQQEELRTTNEVLEEQYKDSEQRKRELERIQQTLEEKAQQLAISSRYKSEFLANMSHELRTPLNSLLILTQLLAENAEGNLTGKQMEYARTIHSSGKDLLHLINDILDLAKVESGNLEVVPEELKLAELREFAEGQFSPVAQEKGVALTVQLDPGLPEFIYTDGHRLKQVLKNLLSNAFKFTEKGSVSLHIQRAPRTIWNGPISVSPQGSLLAFTVADTGIGIPEDKLDLIFEAFKQADGTTSRKYGGTGLGLSISREIAGLLGGSIHVQSEVDKGTVFTLYLPSIASPHSSDSRSSQAEAEAAAALNGQANSSKEEVETGGLRVEAWNLQEDEKTLLYGKKVLIVDDDMRNIFALTTALEGHQMEVLFARNGREGIDVLYQNPDTEVVLMDIMMPEMDGFETIEAIRGMPQFQKLPIIALTAKAMKQDREQCIQAGASDYISKPVNIIQLLSLIQVWVYR